ncbi:CapA family protein [Pseudonocardia sp. D17]|uniref:CapA family protein n=1 Tax=Pseudonocardia sp. D17 TaxID=882661 RepID=UPI002B36BC26|nr:hypothetical protein PSD17_24520 [Pseudonocardia sp. D17]
MAPPDPLPVPDPTAPDPIATDVEDGFTLVAAGDVLAPSGLAVHDRNRDLVALFRAGDVTVANFEAPAVDLRETGHEPVSGGPGWPLVRVPPELPQSLRDWGFDMVGLANNHMVDWGPRGARQTVRLLDEAGIASAGYGETRAAARAPVVLPTPKGRVALLSVTASFRESSAAMDAFGVTPSVPGLSVLRARPVDVVTRAQFEVLREIDAQHNTNGNRFAPPTGGDDLVYRGTRFRAGEEPGTVYDVDAVDEADLLRNIREAKQRTGFVVVSVHNHEEPGAPVPPLQDEGSAWPTGMPPDFLQRFARAAIDHGADVIVGHGPHVLLGIEVYRGRPIYYSLGDLFGAVEQVDLVTDAAPVGFDAARETVADYYERWWTYYARDRTLYHSLVTESVFRDNRLAEIRLHPVDLGADRRLADRGFPETPSPELATAILTRLQRLSEPFGTKITVDGGVGRIHLAGS